MSIKKLLIIAGIIIIVIVILYFAFRSPVVGAPKDEPVDVVKAKSTGSNIGTQITDALGIDNPDSIKGKAAYAKTDNVTVYNKNSTVRKVIKKNEWAGTILKEAAGNVLNLVFSDESTGWITKPQVVLLKDGSFVNVP